ncbi:hypothetical protein LPB140_08855 [Sphingorhabdus lutea]|uniref:Mannose-6-phosphate isomerase n=1 Tax=Sphingorhabdus lutea TaxID=1913578 RepID=A0A1L3JCR3_9SPHN|nr:class I mannose-6-phosphate isomerase [Sphingorhabdus lutea]APG62879.1 hypothetical protein LPB140_08855 [Sphingorhabdus lutea]
MMIKLPKNLVDKPWGRYDLPTNMGGQGRQIGEIWFDDIQLPLPLLVKWLFTSEKLSVQVHPNDAQAMSRGLKSGKEECWVITQAEPNAVLGIGTQQNLNDEELRQAAISGDIEHLMDWKPVKAGDWFYIPAGTIHAIGAGVTLVEIQQNSDITYRLYDYGRPRELHLDDGVSVSVAKPYDDPRHGQLPIGDGLVQLLSSPHFTLYYGNETAINILAEDKPIWLIPIHGQADLSGMDVGIGEVAYGTKNGKWSCDDGCVFLAAYI